MAGVQVGRAEEHAIRASELRQLQVRSCLTSPRLGLVAGWLLTVHHALPCACAGSWSSLSRATCCWPTISSDCHSSGLCTVCLRLTGSRVVFNAVFREKLRAQDLVGTSAARTPSWLTVDLTRLVTLGSRRGQEARQAGARRGACDHLREAGAERGRPGRGRRSRKGRKCVACLLAAICQPCRSPCLLDVYLQSWLRSWTHARSATRRTACSSWPSPTAASANSARSVLTYCPLACLVTDAVLSSQLLLIHNRRMRCTGARRSLRRRL